MSLKEKHQAGEPETERVRIYEFVDYIIHFIDVAFFWNTSKLYREEMSLREKKTEGEHETELVRTHDFVNYVIHLVDVA
jgi:hypothetical protein